MSSVHYVGFGGWTPLLNEMESLKGWAQSRAVDVRLHEATRARAHASVTAYGYCQELLKRAHAGEEFSARPAGYSEEWPKHGYGERGPLLDELRRLQSAAQLRGNDLMQDDTTRAGAQAEAAAYAYCMERLMQTYQPTDHV